LLLLLLVLPLLVLPLLLLLLPGVPAVLHEAALGCRDAAGRQGVPG
jgi:hypothetical protein